MIVKLVTQYLKENPFLWGALIGSAISGATLLGALPQMGLVVGLMVLMSSILTHFIVFHQSGNSANNLNNTPKQLYELKVHKKKASVENLLKKLETKSNSKVIEELKSCLERCFVNKQQFDAQDQMVSNSQTHNFAPKELTRLKSMKKKLNAVVEKSPNEQPNALMQAVKAIAKEQNMRY